MQHQLYTPPWTTVSGSSPAAAPELFEGRVGLVARRNIQFCKNARADRCQLQVLFERGVTMLETLSDKQKACKSRTFRAMLSIGKLLVLVITSIPFRSGCAWMPRCMWVTQFVLVEHTQILCFGQVYPESFLKILDPFPFDYIVQHSLAGQSARTQSQRAAVDRGAGVLPGPTEAPV